MTYFYAKACPEGHYEVTAPKMTSGALCKICGKPLIDKCPECGEYINRKHVYGMARNVPGLASYQLPENCPSCGKPFPWAVKNDENSK